MQTEIMRNVAKNGRLFMAMLFLFNLAAFIDGYGNIHGVLSVSCALIVGAAVIVDQLEGHAKTIAGGIMYSLAGAILILTFLNLGR